MTHSKCLFAHQTYTGFWLVSYSDIRIHHWSLMVGPPICILASLFPSCPDGMQVGSVEGHYHPMRGWNGHPLANQRLGDTDESEGDQWSHLWSPSSGSGLQTWAISGHSRLTNVGCHTVIDMGKAGFFKSLPTNTLYCYPLDIVCIFPPPNDYSDWLCTSLLRSMGCSDVWMSGLCGGVMRMGYVIYSQIRIWTFEKWNMKLLTMLLAGSALRLN